MDISVYESKQNERVAKKWSKKAKKQEPVHSPEQVLYSQIMNVSEGNKGLRILPIWSTIMEVADSKGHFASRIVEDALNCKRISTKQAWVVAFFAKNNGLI